MGYGEVERGLSGRVSEIGTPGPRVRPESKGEKNSRQAGEVGTVLMAAAPLAAMAIPGIGPVVAALIAGSSAIGVGLSTKARANKQAKREQASAGAAQQQAGASSGPRV